MKRDDQSEMSWMPGKVAGADFPRREHRLPLVLGGGGGGEADVNAQIMYLSPLC